MVYIYHSTYRYYPMAAIVVIRHARSGTLHEESDDLHDGFSRVNVSCINRQDAVGKYAYVVGSL